MRRLGVVLLSGGLDSTTVATYARDEGYELTAITLRYGQRHDREVEAAKRVARALDIEHRVVDFSFFSRLAWYSALTGDKDLQVPKGREESGIGRDIPVTYVPLRNTIFITVAAAFIESRALDLIERHGVPPEDVETSVFIAANAIDFSGYPDCRPEYYDAMSRVLLLGSKLGTQYRRPMSIRTPVILKSKADIVRMAVELGAPLEHTWSCYEGGDSPCGKCDSCVLRAKGFSEAGYKDPALACSRDGDGDDRGEQEDRRAS